MNIVFFTALKSKYAELAAFARKHALPLEIHERTPEDMGPRWSEARRFYAEFADCDIYVGSQGVSSRSAFGNGTTPCEAVEDYMIQISGRKLVVKRDFENLIEVPLLFRRMYDINHEDDLNKAWEEMQEAQ